MADTYETDNTTRLHEILENKFYVFNRQERGRRRRCSDVDIKNVNSRVAGRAGESRADDITIDVNAENGISMAAFAIGALRQGSCVSVNLCHLEC
ncbi:hypothetical protein EVAR_20022_1 [Eumeta japonica]|uniref:Uncharacterized protein n=1 Tax=Eumeta variegata TaxID=151549 RepID=A0A4C1VAZ0_EUMVA|nr:hypothetical protein EVAR_20022_1 [Eumeta japonica]